MERRYIRIFLLFLLCHFFCNISFSQSCISIKYDDNGNRIQFMMNDNDVDKKILKKEMVRSRMSNDEYYECEEEIVIYPNPNDGIINVKTNIDNINLLSRYELYNIKGLLICSGEFYEKTTISIENEPDGVYMLKIIMGENVYGKIVVKL